MLQKVLKYDLRAIFKYWWILAVSSFGASIIGGIGLNLFINAVNSTKDINPFLIIFAFLSMLLGFLAISAFVIGNEIFILIRYYRNFFTDEGYLTFTLPVKRSTLFNSKIITALITNLATSIVMIIDIIIAFAISPIGEKFKELFDTAFPEGVFAGLLQNRDFPRQNIGKVNKYNDNFRYRKLLRRYCRIPS